MPSPRNALWLGILFLLNATLAQAHDAIQANTNIWLFPDRMEVELVMARVSARALADNPPTALISEDNFEKAYRPLLLKSVPTMLAFNVEGTALKPRAMDVFLSDETDIAFRLTFDRPTKGVLLLSAPFIKKMAQGYINSVALYEGEKALGFDDEDADHPDSKFTFTSKESTETTSTAPIQKPANTSTIASSPANPSNSLIQGNTSNSNFVLQISPNDFSVIKSGTLYFLASLLFIAVLLIIHGRLKKRE